MSNVQCRNDKSRVEQIRVVDGNVVVVVVVVVRWYSEAHLRVFDRLNKRNDYRIVVTVSCEDRSGRRS
jgi:hypothetical protein